MYYRYQIFCYIIGYQLLAVSVFLRCKAYIHDKFGNKIKHILELRVVNIYRFWINRRLMLEIIQFKNLVINLFSSMFTLL
jgi:hypothetical protein